MKANKYQRRFYRDWVAAKDLCLTHIIARETDLQISTDKPIEKGFIENKIRAYRWEIEDYINKDRRFLTALKPLEVELNASPIVKAMALAAKKVNVGPMAAVAGAIAEFLGRDLLKKGYKDVIVENGGDIFLKTTKKRTIGIYAGSSNIWNKLRLRIKPLDSPLGICTSSGKIGHSLSFGCVDSLVVFSKSTALADAVATAAANRINSKKDLEKALVFSRSIRGVNGVIIILGKNLLTWGNVEFV